LLLFSLSFCVPVCSWVFVFSFKFCWVSQHHGWVCQLLLFLWQKLSGLVESNAGSWWSQWGCHGR
jgi:hypothetical protein